jgi:quinol monooxygenase YgiN
MARNYEPHVIRLDVFEDTSSENVLYCYEAYVDEAGFDKHKGHPRPFQMWTSGLRDECVASTENLLSE